MKLKTLATVAAIALAIGSIGTTARAETAPAIDTQLTQADNGVAKAGCYYRYVWSYYGGYYQYRYFWYCY